MSEPKQKPTPATIAAANAASPTNASDRISDQAYAIVKRFRDPAPEGSGWNNAPSPLYVQALLDGGISETAIIAEYTHYVEDLNGGDAYLAFEGNLKDRGMSVANHLLKGKPYDSETTAQPTGGNAERIVTSLLTDFGEDRVLRALRKLVQAEPV